MALPPEVRANYTTIIDNILASSDINTISVKKIREGIQQAVEYDITPQKAAIKDLIGERFDAFNAKKGGETTPVPSVETAEPAPTANGNHAPSPLRSASPQKRGAESQDVSDVVSHAPAKKKRKKSVEDDAALAARLQAEEERMARPTRGGSSRKNAPAKKKAPKKKKTSTRVRASDDSDVESSEAEVKPQKQTGFHKPLNLSHPLSILFDGETSLSRPQTTKRIWQYIKANKLQDPNDGRFIICDEKMRDVFKQDKVHMFTMTKILNQNLYNPDE